MNAISSAILELTLIAVFGFVLYRRAYIGEQVLKALTSFVIIFTVPALIFTHLIEQSRSILEAPILSFVFMSVAIFAGGCLLGLIFSSILRGRLRQEIVCCVSLQNSGYLPMSLAVFLFPPALREEFLVYIFLYLLGFDVIMWSIGSFFIFKRKGQRFRLASLVTPPVAAILAALILIYTRADRFLPEIVLAPMRRVGELSFVLSMLVLGSWLAKVDVRGLRRYVFPVIGVAVFKLVVLPFIFLAGTLTLGITSLTGLFIVLQAAMPSAATLPVVGQMHGADNEFISQAVFLTHLISIITIPIWLNLYLTLSGFSW